MFLNVKYTLWICRRIVSNQIANVSCKLIQDTTRKTNPNKTKYYSHVFNHFNNMKYQIQRYLDTFP